MRTARMLTVSPSMLRGGVYLVPRGCLLPELYLVPGGCLLPGVPRGVSAAGVYLVPGGVCLLPGEVCSRGVSAPRGCLLLGVYLILGVYLVQGGVCSGGVSAPEGCTWSQGGVCSQGFPGGCLLQGVYLLPGGCVSAPRGVWSWGLYLVQGGVCSGGCLLQRGVPGPGGGCLLLWGCTWSGTPPCGQTDACKLITLPQTSFAGGNNYNNYYY